MAAPQSKSRGIEETLAALEIDRDEDPEVVAQQAALDVANSALEDVPLPDAPAGVPGKRPVDEDDDPATSTVVTEEDDDILMPEMPARALVPTPTRAAPKFRKKETAATGGKISKSLADKVPGAERIKVYKRVEGQKWFVNEYSKADLDLFPDTESFLTKYVKPKHGAGEYDIVGVDATNR